MAPWIPAALKGIWDLGSQYFSNKKEEKQAKHVAKIKLIEQDSALIQQGENSWKDEYWTLILSLPLVQLMLAPVIELAASDDDYVTGQWSGAVLEGLQGIGAAPPEYLYAVGVSVLYSFGIKPTAQSLGNFIKKR